MPDIEPEDDTADYGESEGYGEATAPPKKRIDEEMRARAAAEMDRHEKRSIAKDEQNIRLSAASIARDVLGDRGSTPQNEHTREFFDLAKRVAGWLTNGHA